MMVRCSGCGKPVGESDNICPHCSRDFSAPVEKKAAARPAMQLEPEEQHKEPPPADPPPKAEPERPVSKAEAPAPKEKPTHPSKIDLKNRAPIKLEEKEEAVPTPEPEREPEPEPIRAPLHPEIDNPPAYESPTYAPGAYDRDEDPYTFKKEPSRPPWHWLVLAILCGFGYVSYSGRAPLPVPPPAPPPVVVPVPPPVPTPAVLQPLSDVKDAAATAAAAAASAQAAAIVLPKPPPPTKPAKRHKRVEVPPEDAEPSPEDVPDTMSTAVEPPQLRRSGPPPANEWRIRGTLFDLISAEPVAGADVVFMDGSTGRQFSTGSDNKGNFRATLPVNENGYDLSIRHAKYEQKYFEDGSPSYRKQGPEKRQRAAADLLKVLQHKDFLSAEAGGVLERDFVLIPLSR